MTLLVFAWLRSRDSLVTHESVHCCYVHVCFVQVTSCGAPNALTCIGVCTFLLLSHLLGSQKKFQKESVRTEARQRIGRAKQVSTWSLGQNKLGRNKPVPVLQREVSVCSETGAAVRIFENYSPEIMEFVLIKRFL